MIGPNRQVPLQTLSAIIQIVRELYPFGGLRTFLLGEAGMRSWT